MIELDPKFQELMKSRKPNALLTDFVKRQMFVEQEQLKYLAENFFEPKFTKEQANDPQYWFENGYEILRRYSTTTLIGVSKKGSGELITIDGRHLKPNNEGKYPQFKTYNEIYIPRFWTDGYSVYSMRGNTCEVHALDLDDKYFAKEENENILERIVNLLNFGDTMEDGFENLSWIGDNAGCIILRGDEPFLEVRGWGYLTGRLGMTGEDAALVQDAFARYCVTAMGKKKEN